MKTASWWVLGMLAIVGGVRADPPTVEDASGRLAEAETRGDRRGAAGALVDLGLAHQVRGDLEKAVAALERALRMEQEIGDEAGVANATSALGEVLAERGDFARAMDLLERALRLYETRGDSPGTARALRALAVLHGRVGDSDGALKRLSRALALQQTAGDREAAATTAVEIGEVQLRRGELDEARASFERALAAFETLGERVGAARALVGLAEVKTAKGEHAEAIAALERALPAFTELGLRLQESDALLALGRARLGAGDVAGAREAIERALRTTTAFGSGERQVLIFGALAAARWHAGDAEAAQDAARRAVQVLEGLAVGLSDEEGATLRERIAETLDVGARASTEAGVPAEVWFFLEAGRAISLLEGLAARTALRAASVSVDLEREADEARRGLADATIAYARARQTEDRAAVRAAREAMDRARERLTEASAREERERKRSAQVFVPRPGTLDKARAAMSPSEALVLLQGIDAGPGIALVATRDAVRVVTLAPWSQVVEAALEVHPDRAGEDFAARVEALRALVSTPLALPEGVRTVLVSPDGPLAFVPPILLFPGRDVAYVPSAGVWHVLRQQGERSGKDVLAVADPIGKGQDRMRLPATREEARAVGDVLLLGEDATIPRLREALGSRPRWRSLHFACHAFLELDRPLFSSLALTPAGSDDGALTAMEVMRLPLSADLVVLAANDTGRGKVLRGEGVIGFVRAFLHAGAPRVVASLGGLDDEATRVLLTRFYERWKAGAPTATALREAQEAVRAEERWRHPRFWAPWVLWGLAD